VASGQTAVEYVVQVSYPASQFACRVTKHLEALGWRALREDALNPGNPTGVVVGWREIIDSTRDPESRVHMMGTEWLNEQNDLLVYAFTYEYPVASAPDLSTLIVRASLIPEDVVRAHLGARTDHLRSLLVAPRRDAGGSRDVPPDSCSSPTWSDFVAKTVGTDSPAGALPYELQHIRSIRIMQDIDGLAERIATALKSRVPHVDVVTLGGGGTERPEALLNFRAECRCKEPGAPDGFYIREIVVYTSRVDRAALWTDPPRVLFHWDDGGLPAWKQVPSHCFSSTRSASCAEAFRQADVGFVNALASGIAAR
jgi:hypothetical protein